MRLSHVYDHLKIVQTLVKLNVPVQYPLFP